MLRGRLWPEILLRAVAVGTLGRGRASHTQQRARVEQQVQSWGRQDPLARSPAEFFQITIHIPFSPLAGAAGLHSDLVPGSLGVEVPTLSRSSRLTFQAANKN